jgi:hypothetical protein
MHLPYNHTNLGPFLTGTETAKGFPEAKITYWYLCLWGGICLKGQTSKHIVRLVCNCCKDAQNQTVGPAGETGDSPSVYRVLHICDGRGCGVVHFSLSVIGREFFKPYV